MSLLDDEEILVNDNTFIIEKSTKEFSKKCSLRLFEDFAKKYCIKTNQIDNLYISFSNSENKISEIGEWMTTFLKGQSIKCFLINCKGFSLTNFLYAISQLPSNAVVIFSELSKMRTNDFEQAVKIMKEWNIKGDFSFKRLYDEGIFPEFISTLEDKELKKENYSFIFLDTDKHPKSNYFYLNPSIYGEFFIDHSNHELLRRLKEVFQFDDECWLF